MQEIKLEDLDDGPGVLPFKLGPSYIISHYHSFLQYVDLQDMQNKISSISSQLEIISPDLHNKTMSLFEPHINYLKSKLQTVLEQLQTFEINRVKRGLVDGLGSVVKSITGNLDYTDAIKYNNAIKSLQENDNRLVTELNSHVSLTKDWIVQHSKILDSIVENQNKLETIINKISQSIATQDNDLVKYAHLAQILLILGDNVDLISQEITKLQNVLAFIKTSTTHHSVITFNSTRYLVNRLVNLYGRDKIIDLDVREYYDVVQLGSYYVGNRIVIVYKFPIILPQVYDLYKISIVPNRNHEILTPKFPFLAIHSKDFKYIEAECPKSSKGYLCEEIHNLQSRMSEDCIQQLILTQQRSAACNPVTVALEKPAFEKLDDRHYTISFPKPTKVHLSCGQDLYKILQGSYLTIVPVGCYMETAEFIISNSYDRLKGQALKIIDIPREEADIPQRPSSFKLNSINLDHLHATNTKISLQHPVILENSADNSLYHTTIPLYIIILCTCILICGLAYRRYYLKKQRADTDEHLEAGPSGNQRVYATPAARRVDSNSNQPPAQFTTSVFNRCSSGGGVTQA